jgi:hypothetical protein
VMLGQVGERKMGSPAVDPFLVALDERVESERGSRAAERTLVALVVAVQLCWIAVLAYTAYVFLT